MGDVTCRVVNKHGTHLTLGVTYGAPFPVNLETARFVGGGGEPGPASFTVHPFEPNLAHLTKEHMGGKTGREVQLWEGGACRWWGIPLGYSWAEPESLRFRLVDLKQYPKRSAFGPIVTNFWTDPDFEDPLLPDWTVVGAITKSSATDWRAKGQRSMRLQVAAAGLDAYVRQRYSSTTGPQAVAFFARVVAFAKKAGWIGPAFEERGLYVAAHSSPGGPLLAGVSPNPVYAKIGNGFSFDDPLGVLLEAPAITIPASTSFTLESRFYSGGDVYVDNGGLRTEESVGSDLDGDTAAVVATRIVQHMQDPGWGHNDLNLPVQVVGADTSPPIVQHHQFYANGSILAALNEMVARRLLDWDIAHELDGSARYVRIWPAPALRGASVPAGTLTVNLRTNVVDPGLEYDIDGSGIVRRSRRTGRGSNATRETAVYVDPALGTNPTLDHVESATTETTPDALWDLAKQDVEGNASAKERTAVSLPASVVWGLFGVGDRITHVADWGPAMQVNVEKRVATLDWRGDGSMGIGTEDA